MGKKEDLQHKLARKFRTWARSLLLIMVFILFLFVIFSGNEQTVSGLEGVAKSSPNAAPWATLLLFIIIAWKWELLGGFLIVAMGVFSIFFFDIFSRASWPILFMVSLPLMVMGSLLIGAWGLSEKK